MVLISVCCTTFMMPMFPMFLIYVTDFLLLISGRIFGMKAAIRHAAKMWVCYLKVWHNHSIKGLDNIPAEGAGLIVWYHGPIPVDYLGLLAQLHLKTGRRVSTVVDKCLQYLPGLKMFIAHLRCGSFSKVQLAGLLEAGELVGVSPGGARECIFDDNCSVMWRNRTGFAKVAHLTRIPIIPVYTENIRLAYRTMQTGSCLSRFIFEATKLPFVPFYGGFPVELITHVGEPVLIEDGESMIQLHQRVQSSLKSMIEDKKGHHSIMEALGDRFSLC